MLVKRLGRAIWLLWLMTFLFLFVRLVVKIALAVLLGLSDENCPVCGVFALRLVLLCPRCQCWRGLPAGNDFCLASDFLTGTSLFAR